ncbi:hypothetical protein [Rheinheimera sp. F8]|uniref:hypothetical protein n=1 Tax=Rheinheimera sp. F8 TaxID=1763998 RepID=UPI001AD83018|nr:hypothetical protein [Rheinheimera sp. F8]
MSRSWYDTHLALAIAGAFFTLSHLPSQETTRQPSTGSIKESRAISRPAQANSQQPTTNNQQPTANSQQPTFCLPAAKRLFNYVNSAKDEKTSNNCNFITKCACFLNRHE